MKLNDLRDRCHQANLKWWKDLETGSPIIRNKGELICLMHSETSEAFEGSALDLKDDKLTHLEMQEVELIDILIRLFDYAGGFGYDMNRAAMEFGVVEFKSLTDLSTLAIDGSFDDGNCGNIAFAQVWNDGLSMIHYGLSRLMELERKSAPEDVIEKQIMIVFLLVICHCSNLGFDISGVFEQKMEYNRTRNDHTHEARRAEGGKKF